MRLGGQLIQQSERPSLSGEGIGILAAILILLIAFGSVLAMALPIVVALAGIAVGLAIIGLLTHVYPLQSFSTTLATMIGIGVGIDYALFVVTRYRQGLQAGLDPEEAVVTAVDTSGRAVLFAGLTVIIALLGMLAIGLSFISGLGIGAAAVVAVTVLVGDHAAARDARVRRQRTSTGCGCRGCTTTATARARRSGTAGAGSCSATRGCSPSPGSRSCSRSRCRCCRCGSASSTPATTRPASQTRQAYDLVAQGLRPRVQRPVPARDPDAGRRRPHRRPREAARRARRDARRRVGRARDHAPRRARPRSSA